MNEILIDIVTDHNHRDHDDRHRERNYVLAQKEPSNHVHFCFFIIKQVLFTIKNIKRNLTEFVRYW